MLLSISARQSGNFKKYMTDTSIKPTGVILFNQQEWQYNSIGNDPGFEGIVDYVNKYDIPLYIVNGTVEEGTNILHDVTNPRYKNIQPIMHYPGYFLTTWFQNFESRIKSADDIDNIDYKYVYVSLNNKPHWHRCLQMDLLVKNNLLDCGAVSWNMWFLDQGRILDQKLSYEFRYWTPEILLLDELKEGKCGWENQLPEQYHESYVQLISESTINAMFLTEKTVPAFILHKPFIVSGPKNFHKMLTSFGFKLYDEIFDYSFDSEDDIEKRFDMICQNLINLKKYTPDEFKFMYKKLWPKLEHNSKLLRELATDANLIPEFVRNLIKNDDEAVLNQDIYHYYHLKCTKNK